MAREKEKQGQKIGKKPHGFSGVLRAFIAGIPQAYIVRVGRLLGILVYFVDARHRRIVRRNLQFTHPELSQESIRILSRRVFQNIGITFLEICQMTCFSREDVLRKVRIRGKDNLDNAVKSSKGIIIISGHLGNWEMGPLLVSCYLQKPLVVVARKIHPEMLDRWIHRLRVRFGNIVIDKKRALPKMARTLNRGNILGLLIDQGTKLSRGIEVKFFDQTANSTPAPALLARRYDSPVLPAFCIREADAGLTLVIEPPLVLKRTDDLRADLQENTQIMTSAVEKAVREHPEQWFWFHKRWKRFHPYLYPEELARRHRRKEKRKVRLTKA